MGWDDCRDDTKSDNKINNPTGEISKTVCLTVEI